MFFTCGARRNIHIVDGGPDGYPIIVRSKTIENYLDVPPYHGVAIYGQPAQQVGKFLSMSDARIFLCLIRALHKLRCDLWQLYFHRPIHELFSTFFKVGLVMDAVEEPAFTSEDAVPEMIHATPNFTQLPTILAFRMRRVV